jgi:hypothetical protein
MLFAFANSISIIIYTRVDLFVLLSKSRYSIYPDHSALTDLDQLNPLCVNYIANYQLVLFGDVFRVSR